MKKRKAIAVAVAVLVVVVGVSTGAAMFYPLSYDETNTAADDRFTFEPGDEYRVTGEIESNGEPFIDYEAEVAADGERHTVNEGPVGITETYRPDSDSDLYRMRIFTDDEAAEQAREAVEDSSLRTLVNEERNGEETRFLIVDERVRDADASVGTDVTLFLNGLGAVGYERVEEGDAHVYEPETGWYDSTSPYRTTDAAGHVIVDADTYSVTAADVTIEMVEAESYVEFLQNRDEPERLSVTFDVEPNADVDEPEWVADLREER